MNARILRLGITAVAGLPGFSMIAQTPDAPSGAPIAEDAGRGKTTLISFKPVRTKFLRIAQTGAEENAPAWSIQKLRLYQPTDTKVTASSQ